MKPFITTALHVFVLMSLSIIALSAEPLKPGVDAPRLNATTDTGEEIALGDLYDAGPVLVYFYPKADTPGCTKQACNLRDNFEALTDNKVTVIGVSGDSVASQARFKAKYELPFTLLADTDSKICDAFGVPRKGKFPNRQSFLVKDGKVIWADRKATPKTQAQDALAALGVKSDSET